MGDKQDGVVDARANDRYMPVPHERPWRYEEDGYTVTRTTAWTGPGCHEGCGLLLYTDENDVLVKVEGDREDPFNQGRLCARCLALPDVVNHPDRLKKPMKRAKEDRGKDAWVEITWDEAFDLIEEKLRYYRDEFGPESVAFWQGTGRDITPYITRLCWSFGSPNYVIGLSGVACYCPRMTGCALTNGLMLIGDYSQQYISRYDDPNWKVPGVIFVWGNNPVVSNSDGMYGHWVTDCMKRGSKVVCIDPKRTWLANKSDLLLQLRPGTDVALAMGMLNVLIAENLYDAEFVDLWCYGFEELAEAVRGYTPERVEEITWVPADKIREAARMLGTADGAIVQWGVAVDFIRESLGAGQAITALFQITGNVDKPGAMICPPPGVLGAAWGIEYVTPEMKMKRIGAKKYPLFANGMVMCQTDELISWLEDPEYGDYPMKALWLQTSNPLACTGPDPERAYKALMNFEFVVGIDLFMTPSIMALADVVLPAQTFAERNGMRARVAADPEIIKAINKVTQIGDTKSDMEINLEIGRRLAPEAWPWESVEEMYDSLLEPTGKTLAELREEGPLYPGFEYDKHVNGKLRADGQPGFNTRTGRIELFSTVYHMLGLDPVPSYYEPEPGPVSTPELFEKYPLILSTGARTPGLFHSEHRQIPHLRAIQKDPILQINPDTAAEFGVEDGQWCWVENYHGRAKRRVEIAPHLVQGVVSTDHGWWYPEAEAEMDKGLYGVWDVNINNLLEWIPGRAGVGSGYRSSICTVYPVKEGE